MTQQTGIATYPDTRLPSEYPFYTFLKVHYDGGSREAGAASAWVLSGRLNEAAAWVEIADSGFPLGPA